MSSDEERTELGRQLAAKLFAGAQRGTSGPSPEVFRDYTYRHLFGEVWQGTELTLQERSIATCTTLIALNRTAEQRLHFLGAKNLGVPREKIEGLIAHLAHYAGWPCAASASGVLNEVWPVATAQSG